MENYFRISDPDRQRLQEKRDWIIVQLMSIATYGLNRGDRERAKNLIEYIFAREEEISFGAGLGLYETAGDAVKRVLKHIDNDILGADPNFASRPSDEFLPRLYRTFKRTLSEVAFKAERGSVDPFARIRTMKHGKEIYNTKTHDMIDRPVNVGYLAISSTPPIWGHLLVAAMSMNILNLDMVVIRGQGEIGYKRLKPENRVSIRDRHEITKKILTDLDPVFRYTDLGSEPGSRIEGFEEMVNFLVLNRGRRINIVYLISIENEKRVRSYIELHYKQ